MNDSLHVIFYIETIEERATNYFKVCFAYKSRSAKLHSIYLPKQDVQVECQTVHIVLEEFIRLRTNEMGNNNN